MKRKRMIKSLGNILKRKKIDSFKPGSISRNERLSLKLRLSLSHILITAIPVLLTVIIATSQASSSLLNKVNDSNLAYTTQATQMIDNNISNIENMVTTIVYNSNLNTTVGKNPSDYEGPYEMMIERKDNFDSVILALQSSNKNIKKIFLVKENEIIGAVPNETQLAFVNECVASYNTGDIQEDKPKIWYYDDAYIYVLKNINSFQNGRYIGVLVMQIDKQMFLDNLKNTFGGQAKVALLDPVGQIILTPEDQEAMGELKYFNTLREKLVQSKEKGEATTGIYTTREGFTRETSIMYGNCLNQWIFVMQIPVSEILEDIQRLRVISFLFAAITVAAAALIGIWLAMSIARPIDYIRKKLKLVEQGNLTVSSDIGGKYEIGQLSQSFNHMTANMRELLQKVDSAAETVSSNSHELQQIAENSADASSEIVRAVESITIGAEEQAKESEEAATVVRELVELVHSAETHFTEVVKATDSTRQASSKATRTMEHLTEATNAADELSQGIRLSIKTLGERINEISGIIRMINDISGQTNLLALNAAIEAARVGEAGKGFAVVAGEVNKLADQSAASVKSITSIIKNIVSEMKQTETMIEEGSSIYVQQGGAVTDTQVIFREVANNMDTISKKVDSVYEIMEKIDQVKDKAADAITGIAAIAQEAAAATEEVLARGEEQTSTAEQLKGMSVEMKEVISLMREQMGMFTIADAV